MFFIFLNCESATYHNSSLIFRDTLYQKMGSNYWEDSIPRLFQNKTSATNHIEAKVNFMIGFEKKSELPIMMYLFSNILIVNIPDLIHDLFR